MLKRVGKIAKVMGVPACMYTVMYTHKDAYLYCIKFSYPSLAFQLSPGIIECFGGSRASVVVAECRL